MSIKITNGQVTDLAGIQQFKCLKILKLKGNQVKVSDKEEMSYIFTKLMYLELSV